MVLCEYDAGPAVFNDLEVMNKMMGTVICSDYVSYTALHRSARMRSKTFPGIAAAMADQWSRLQRIE